MHISRRTYDPTQYLVLLGFSLAAVGFGALVRDHPIFQRLIGAVNPMAAALATVAAGALCFHVLLSRRWFAVYRPETGGGRLRTSILAILPFVAALLADVRGANPADLNVLFPESLLFYPTIAFFVEILFHIVPLTVLLLTLTTVARNMRRETAMWICIIVVAAIEPVFQTAGKYSLPATIYIGSYILMMNVIQLVIFVKRDFTSMYAFRLAYYILWHIAWGYVRLRVLF